LECEPGEFTAVKITSCAGEVVFDGVPSGECRVDFSMPGYERETRTVVVSKGRNRLLLTIPEPLHVSLINLIATPERYDGLLVDVKGFLGVGEHFAGLFLHEDDYRIYAPANAVRLDLERNELASLPVGEYVMVRGVYEAERGGQVFSGKLRSIRFVTQAIPAVVVHEE